MANGVECRVFSFAIVGAKREGFGERSGGAAEVAGLVLLRAGTAEVRNRAVEAHVRMHDAAVGEQFQTIDGIAVGAVVDGFHGLGELARGR